MFEISAAAPAGVAADFDNVAAKQCSLCKETRLLTDFHVRSGRKGGRQSKCKTCACAQRAKWREEHQNDEIEKEKARQRTSAWRARFPEKAKELSGRWSKANPQAARAAVRRHIEKDPKLYRQKQKARDEERAEELRAYRQRNAHKRAETRKRWIEANPGIDLAFCAARRARLIMAMPKWADRKAISEIYRQAKEKTKNTGVQWHVDHIIPLKHKLVCGLHVPQNLQVLPGVENVRKSNRFIP